jgi:hypothetical protein
MVVDFMVRGVIDGRSSTARWEGDTLDADPELISRAQIVVAMGEQFRTEDGCVVDASLDGGVATVLTLMRAFTVVTAVVLRGARGGATVLGQTAPSGHRRWPGE